MQVLLPAALLDLKSDGPIVDLNFNAPAVGAIFRW